MRSISSGLAGVADTPSALLIFLKSFVLMSISTGANCLVDDSGAGRPQKANFLVTTWWQARHRSWIHGLVQVVSVQYKQLIFPILVAVAASDEDFRVAARIGPDDKGMVRIILLCL